MALTRFIVRQSDVICPKPSCTVAILVALCYVVMTVDFIQGVSPGTPPFCRDAELSGAPRLQKLCSAFREMVENNQFIDDPYIASKFMLPSRTETSDVGSKREEPSHVFLRFGRKR